MAKLTLTDIASGFQSNTAANANNTLIETAIEKTLFRDGTGPNQMEANLDMNGFLILNQANPIPISGMTWEGPWSSAQNYSVGDIVQYNGTTYIAIVEHLSTGFTTDLADNKWQIFSSATFPDQSMKAGKFLKTDGSSVSWETVTATGTSFVPANNISSSTVQAAIEEMDTEKVPYSQLASSIGTTLVGTISSSTGAVSRTLKNKLYDIVSVKDFGAVGDGSNDDTSAIQAAIDSVTSLSGAHIGGEVIIPPGYYKTTSPILMKHGVSLVGTTGHAPGGSYDGSSVLLGVHTGAAVLSLKGAHGCKVKNITLMTTSGAIPKTGLMLGRASSASAGLHVIESINVIGYYSAAAIYSIASESNVWIHPTTVLQGGGALYSFYTSMGDELSVDSMVASSNVNNTLIGGELISFVNSASARGIMIRGGASVGSWNFVGVYMVQATGDYVELQNGAADGQVTMGPITFTGSSGEIGDLGTSNSPLYGFDISGTTGISGLTINGARFQLRNNTGNERIFHQDATVTLYQPSIHMQANAAAAATLQQDHIVDGIVSVGLQTFTGAGLLNSWTNTFATANGYNSVGYWKDPMGVVHLQGIASGGTINQPIFTLPVGFRPPVAVFMPAISNGALGQLAVLANGNVLPAAGSNVYFSLDGVTFKAG